MDKFIRDEEYMLRKTAYGLLCTFMLLTMASCEQKTGLPKSVQKVERAISQKNTMEKPLPSGVQQEDSNKKVDDPTLPDVTLQKGDQGENVASVQKALKDMGYTITADGIFGNITAQAIYDLKSQIQGLEKNSIYDSETEKAMMSVLGGKVKILPGKTKPAMTKQETNSSGENPDQVVTDPTNVLVLVNKSHRLPDGYRPPDLVEPKVPFPFKEKLEKRLLRKVAGSALEKLFAGAQSAGLHLYAQSGFRSYERQKAIFASNAKKYGEKKANMVSAYPGESEHQTGLTMDVTTPSVNYDLIEPFGTTAEGRWLKEHAHEYGFIIRYPKGKEAITGYSYEPWHIRYVGVKAASEMAGRGITLEEYLGEK